MTITSDYLSKPLRRETAQDVALLAAVARRDEAAFEALYQYYAPKLYTYLVNFLGDRAAAEDVLQQAFWAVWQRAGGFRQESSVATWLYRIAHYQAISWLRQQRPTIALTEITDLELLEDDVALQAAHNWEIAQMQTALTQLAPPHRALVELLFGQGFSQSETAQILGLPLGTVKSRLAALLRQLAKLLSSNEDTEGRSRK